MLITFKYSRTLLELSISVIVNCLLVVFSTSSFWFDSNYLFKALTFLPLTDLRINSLTYLSLNV